MLSHAVSVGTVFTLDIIPGITGATLFALHCVIAAFQRVVLLIIADAIVGLIAVNVTILVTTDRMLW